MWPINLLRSSKSRTQHRATHRIHRARVVLGLEPLEDRCLMSTDMVTNLSGDPTVKDSLPWWVANAQAGDTILFQQGLQGTIAPTSSNGTFLTLSKDLSIVGPGANVLTISGNIVNSGSAKEQVLSINAGVTASVSGLTIANGLNANEGGGIWNKGNLTLTNVEVTNNISQSLGGGIANGGFGSNATSLTLIGCTVDHNQVQAGFDATGEGGGIYNDSDTTLTMFNDTVADNVINGLNVAFVGYGGGIYNAAATGAASGLPSGSIGMVNVTIANNGIIQTASYDGNGIFNESSFGANGVYNGGSLALFNSIVYNPGGIAEDPDVSGRITYDGSGNLFGSNVSNQIQGGTVGSAAFDLFNRDPMLGPLQNNGGPTPTMALSPTSSAIGAGIIGIVTSGGFVSAPGTDQRGLPRPSDSMDIGAYQYQLPPPQPQPLPPPNPGPPSPIGSLTLFGLGFGPGMQLDIFEVDQAGEVFALPLIDLFGGQGGIRFVSSSVVLNQLMLQDQEVLGDLVGANDQSYFIDVLDLFDTYVLNAALNALHHQSSPVPAPSPSSSPSSSPPTPASPPSSGSTFGEIAGTYQGSLSPYGADDLAPPDGPAKVQHTITLTINADGSGSFSINPSGSSSLQIPLPVGSISLIGSSLEFDGQTAAGQVHGDLAITNGVLTLGGIEVWDNRVGPIGGADGFTTGQLQLVG